MTVMERRLILVGVLTAILLFAFLTNPKKLTFSRIGLLILGLLNTFCLLIASSDVGMPQCSISFLIIGLMFVLNPDGRKW